MDRAKRLIEKYKGAGKLGVAVSGGVDSMTLLHLVLSCVQPENVVVLNVEHGIRGEASVSDSDFVHEYAKSRGVAFIQRSVSVPKQCEASGRSEETEARLARHEFFADMLDRAVVDFVLLAHNEGDNTESVLMHVLRGAGCKGLLGMKEEDGKYLRPLLGVSRSKIEAYAAENGIPFVVDASNANSKYNRNFLRNEILPLIRKRYDVDGAVKKLSENATADEEYICSSICFDDYVKSENDCVTLDLKAFQLAPALNSRLIFECARRLGRFCDVTAKHVDAVRSLSMAENGKRVDLGNLLTAAREYDCITFYACDDESEADEVEFSIGFTSFGNGAIEIYPCDAVSQKDKLIIDSDKVPYGSVIRCRRNGDVFKPFGGGTKKLKEYLIDKKIPLRKRDKMPLLCYNEKVLAIFGVEISDEVKITEKTVNAVELKFTED